MCRSNVEGGRRCPSCGSAEAQADANRNRRISRAQRSAVVNEITAIYGDSGDTAKEAARIVRQSNPSALPAIIAMLDTHDPEAGAAIREAALAAGGGRHLPGVHNQVTLNDRSGHIAQDYDETGALKDAPNAVSKAYKAGSALTYAFLDSERSSHLTAEEREALTNGAVIAETVYSNVSPSGKIVTDLKALDQQTIYSMRNLNGEELLNVALLERSIQASHRANFIKNCSVTTTPRPVTSDKQLNELGIDMGNKTTVDELTEQMEELGLDEMTIRDGVVLRYNPDHIDTGEPPYLFDVDNGTAVMPALPDARVVPTTARIPHIEGFTASGDISKDDQHITMKRLTGDSNTREAKELRKQLSSEIIHAAFNSGKDVGSDFKWEEADGMVRGKPVTIASIIDNPIPGKKKAVSHRAMGQLGLAAVAETTNGDMATTQMPSTVDATIKASMGIERNYMDHNLVHTTKYRPAVGNFAGTTVHGHIRPQQNLSKVAAVSALGQTTADRSRKAHRAAMVGLDQVRETTVWNMEQGFKTTESSSAKQALADFSTDTGDIDDMLYASARYNTASDRAEINNDTAIKALAMDRAITRARGVNMLNDHKGTSEKATMVTTFRLPKGENPYNVFREGRTFTPKTHLATSIDGTGIPATDNYEDGTPVRMVINTSQGVAFNPERGIIPESTPLRIAHYTRDDDGTVTIYAVDESTVLEAANA